MQTYLENKWSWYDDEAHNNEGRNNQEEIKRKSLGTSRGSSKVMIQQKNGIK